MKTQRKFLLNRKFKIFAIVAGLIIALGLTTSLLKALNRFFDTHYLSFNQVVELSFNKPISIKTREVKAQEIIKVVEGITPDDLNTDIEKYICNKFGPYECKTAIAIARTESGLKELAFNTYNKNGTLDIGIFQINSSHFNQEGCSLKELVDEFKNVDCAYKIFQASGWSAWSAYKSNAFVSQLN